MYVVICCNTEFIIQEKSDRSFLDAHVFCGDAVTLAATLECACGALLDSLRIRIQLGLHGMHHVLGNCFAFLHRWLALVEPRQKGCA